MICAHLSVLQINSEVSSQHILISNLPKMEIEPMLHKLEIHFSKTKHGGGEVEKCEMLPDSWTVALTFLKSDSEQASAIYNLILTLWWNIVSAQCY